MEQNKTSIFPALQSTSLYDNLWSKLSRLEEADVTDVLCQ